MSATATRPLGKLSDFVREQIPTLQPADFAKAEKFLPTPDQLGKLHADSRAVALLDLKMLYVAAHVHGYKVDSFAACVKNLNALMNRPDVLHLTYEDIILNNPPSDTRVFTPGAVGESEKQFYLKHKEIENNLAVAIDNLVKRANFSKAHDHIELCVDQMKSFYTMLDKNHFSVFKKFFDTHEDTKEKGPSGAFSAKIQHIGILLYGKKTPGEIINYLEENKNYFPVNDYAAITAEQRNAPGVIASTDGDNQKIAEQISQLMIRFRQSHYGVVKKTMGDNPHGSAEGNEASNLLKTRINDNKNAHRTVIAARKIGETIHG